MTVAQDYGTEDNCLWTVADLATFLQIPIASIYQWHHKGIAPPSIKLGKHRRYMPSQVHGWLREQETTGNGLNI